MKIDFDSESGDAFEGIGWETEVPRILRKIIAKIENGDTSGTILDVNGNTAGTWSL